MRPPRAGPIRAPRPPAEGELLRLNRTLRALSNSSQAMRAEDESAFLAEVCRIVVEDCGHAMVWVGYADDDEGKTVRPVAQAGYDQSYLDIYSTEPASFSEEEAKLLSRPISLTASRRSDCVSQA